MKKMDIITKEWITAFCIALILVLILYNILWPMRIQGKSMENTLYNGDFVLVSRVLRFFEDYEYGEIIVVNNSDEQIAKRIIGMEGDHIVISDGKVYRNSQMINEYYVKGETKGEIDIHVPKNCLFILGDYRDVSRDSRNFGCVDQDNIIAKLIKLK